MENNEKNNSVKTEQQIKRNNNPRKKRIVKKTKENKAEVKNINQEVELYGWISKKRYSSSFKCNNCRGIPQGFLMIGLVKLCELLGS